MQRSLLVLLLTATVLPAGVLALTPQEIVEGGKLKQAYNPVLLDYLLVEGADALPEALRKQALDQLVTALQADIEITPEEQQAAALAAAGAGLAQLLGGRDAADLGAAAGSATYQVWKGWVDSAVTLQKAGYTDEANAFFEKCIDVFPYSDLKGRCAIGLAAGKPAEAYDRLVALTEANDPEVINAALRLLGRMAGQEGFPAAQRQTVIERLTSFTGGMKKASYGLAACHGLVATGDPAVVPTLQKLAKGMMNTDFYACSRRGLLLTFDDSSVVPLLEKSLKGGSFSTVTPADQLAAGSLLVEAGHEKGYTWAAGQFDKSPAKGFKKMMKVDKDDVDLRPSVVDVLVRTGGDRAVAVLREAMSKVEKGSWLETWIAVGLADLGDATHLGLVRAALGQPDWEFTTVRVATALSRHGDLSGIPALASLYDKAVRGVEPSAGKVLLTLLGADDGNREGRLLRLRLRIADGLAAIDTDDAVGVLRKMLDDAEPAVRVHTAYALARMSTPAAAGGLAAALQVDYGSTSKASRNPTVHAHLVRAGARRHEGEAATRELLELGMKSELMSVRFLSLCAAGKG